MGAGAPPPLPTLLTFSPCCLLISLSVSQSNLFPTKRSSASSEAYCGTTTREAESQSRARHTRRRHNPRPHLSPLYLLAPLSTCPSFSEHLLWPRGLLLGAYVVTGTRNHGWSHDSKESTLRNDSKYRQSFILGWKKSKDPTKWVKNEIRYIKEWSHKKPENMLWKNMKVTQEATRDRIFSEVTMTWNNTESRRNLGFLGDSQTVSIHFCAFTWFS